MSLGADQIALAQLTLEQQQRLVHALQAGLSRVYPCRLLQTHISYVLLTGEFAYKIKKAVDLGFLNFTTLARRRFYCEEELRLNRRLAPRLYLDVVPITGSVEQPHMRGLGPTLEYAVKMREFAQSDLADQLLKRGALTTRDIDDLAQCVADFHAGAKVAAAGVAFGTPAHVLAPALQNFEQIDARLRDDAQRALIAPLRDWTQRCFARLEATLDRRKTDGYVRECHGDLHLGNIARIDGAMTIFDCIEFNDELRWIDVINEIAFLTMDLDYRARADLAWRALNRYLEATGDYAGIELLDFYRVYRALVRAKVALLRGDAAQDFQRHLQLAARYVREGKPALIITHGLSGSGKTTATQTLLEKIGAIRVRSDVERKRLFGLDAMARSNSAVDRGLYDRRAGQQTYARLAQVAETLLRARRCVIVDATFLLRAQREQFRAVARAAGCEFVILDFVAQESTLCRRVAEREKAANDASEASLAVLKRQLSTAEALAPDEPRVVIDAERELAVTWAGQSWHELTQRLGGV